LPFNKISNGKDVNVSFPFDKISIYRYMLTSKDELHR